jgi:hypothetical protein
VEPLIIESTKSTPRVDFNANNRILIIQGQSYPENSFKFYDPIFQWLDMFFATVENDDGLIKLEISFPYINTSSTKCILMLLEKCEAAEKNGRNMDVTWYYDKENENELECAQDFKEYVELEFNLIAV